jgi:hypothetical protein
MGKDSAGNPTQPNFQIGCLLQQHKSSRESATK